MIETPRKLPDEEMHRLGRDRALKLAVMIPQTAFKHPNRPHHKRFRHKHPKHGR